MQAALVEELGGEGANVGMQAPRLFEEQSAVRRDRGMGAKNVVERRHVGAFRMAALHGLLELPRIAQAARCSSRPATPPAHSPGTFARPRRRTAHRPPRAILAAPRATLCQPRPWQSCQSPQSAALSVMNWSAGMLVFVSEPSGCNVSRCPSRPRFRLRHPASCG